MATTNTRYVDPNSTAGGDGTTNALSGANRAYVSLNAWEAARQANLVTGDIIERVVCSSDDAGSTHAADTTACAISGWTTDATRYIQIEAASSHGGKWNAGIYRLTVTNNDALSISEDFVEVSGLQIQLTVNNGSSYNAIKFTNVITGTITLRQIHHCIAVGVISGAGSRGSGIVASWISSGADDRLLTIYNCLAYDFINGTTNCYGIIGDNGWALSVYNCTIDNCYQGIRDVDGTVAAYNCGATNCTYPWGSAGTVSRTTCSSTTPTYVDSANDDYHLASGDTTWINQGTDYSATFTTDIDGETRPTGAGTWDIGADEYMAAGFPGYIAEAQGITDSLNRTASFNRGPASESEGVTDSAQRQLQIVRRIARGIN